MRWSNKVWCSIRAFLLWCFILASASLSLSAAEAAEWPIFQEGTAEHKSFTVKKHYPFKEYLYTPPLKLEISESLSPPFGSPEAALNALVTAKINLDYYSWKNTWDQSSKLLYEMDARDKKKRIEQWKHREIIFKTVITRWILKGKYVIMVTRFISHSGKENGDEIAIAFKVDRSKGWKATLDLVDDPAFKYFFRKDENNVIEMPVDDSIRLSTNGD